MKVSATVTGVDKQKKRLVDILPAKMREKAGAAMLAGADRIVSRAVGMVPRESGELAASIHRTDLRIDDAGQPYVAVVAGNKATEVTSAGGTFQKARLVEFGTQKTPAEPFFFVSYRSQKRGIRAAIRRAIRDAVRDS